MYSVSNDFLTKVASASRQFVARMSATNGFLVDSDEVYLTDADGYFLINGVVPETSDIPSDKFLSFTINGGTNSEEDFSLGSCVSQCLNVELNGNKLITQGAEYLLEIGLVLDDDSIEYIPMGYFIAQKPETTEYKTTATLYDRMIFLDAIATPASTLPETTTTLAVLALIEDTLGIPVDTTGLIAISMTRPDTTKSWRTALQTIAQLYGGFSVIDRDGNLCIKKYDFNTTVATIGAGRYTAFTHADEDYTLLNLYVITGYDANGAEVAYSSGTGTGGIFFNNADMTQALLDSIYAYYENMSYMPSEISSMLGRPEIDVWDCVSVTDLNGVAYTVPLMSRELSFDGGLTDSISAYGKSEAEQLNAYQSLFSNLLKQTNGLLNVVAKKINFAVEGQYLSSSFEISDSAITSITDKFVIKGSDGTTTVISGGQIQADSITADELNVTDLYAIGATIGSFTIDSTAIYSGSSLTDTSTGAVAMSTASFAREIAGEDVSGLRLAVGRNFGVDASGIVHAANIDIYSQTFSNYMSGTTQRAHFYTQSGGGRAFSNIVVEYQEFANDRWTVISTPFSIGQVYGSPQVEIASTSSFYVNGTATISTLYATLIGSSTSYVTTAYITNIYGTVVGTSDRNAKTEISELNPEKSAEFIYSLKPCEYKFKDGTSGRKHHGLIAQEVKESMGADDWGVYVDQNAKVESDADKIESPLGLRYSEFIADLIATVQSQNERITALENKIKELEVNNE